MINLLCDRISKTFKQGNLTINVLHNITVQFQQSITYAITGVSGTGKSTFMHILAGLDEPTSGTVSFEGRNLATFTAKERSVFLNKSIGLMFQYPYLINEFSVLENVMMPGLLGGEKESVCKKYAKQLLVEVGLGEKVHNKPAMLSGGQQQRVALARALLNKPKFLLADEPTGNLDIETGKTMVDLLLKCKELYGMGLIISTHDQYVAHRLNEHYELKKGSLEKYK